MRRLLIAYYRVSTRRQGESGLGLEAQRQAVEAYALRAGAAVLAEYVEIESGRRCDRPQLEAAFGHARATGASVVVAKLDRLARDARFLLGLVDRGVPVVFLDLPALEAGDPTVGRLVLTVMAAIAEFEARRIAQRIREAAAVRRRRGEVMGWRATKGRRNPLTEAHRLAGSACAREANLRAAAEYRAAVLPLLCRLRESGLRAGGIAAELNRQGCLTRRGRPWTAANVSRLLCGRADEAPP